MQLKYAIQSTGEVKLIYALNPRIPVCIDAQKGIFVNYFSDEPYKAVGALAYSVIKSD